MATKRTPPRRPTPSKPITTAQRKAPTLEDLFPAAYVVSRNINLLAAYHGNTRDELIRAMGCKSDWTIRDRRDHPYNYTVAELSGLAKLWGLTVGQLMEPMQVGVMG